MLHLGCGVADGIQNRHEIGRIFRRTVNLAARIDARIARVGGDFVMQISGVAAPFPFGDHNIALDSSGPFRFGERKLAFRNPRRPVGKQSDRAGRFERTDVTRHLRLRATRLDAPRPGVGGIRELVAEGFRQIARPGRAQRMTGDAAARLQGRKPSALTLHMADGKFGFRRHMQHRKPIDRGIIIGGRRCARCLGCRKVE